MYEYDHEFMYTDLASAQELLVARFDDGQRRSRSTSPIRGACDPRATGSKRSSGTPTPRRTGCDLNGALFSALKLEKMAMAIILFLIVIVAAFNIISTLIMVVADKTREIGILKSMGMTDGGFCESSFCRASRSA